ncbi:MAG: YebC/PmpR family DNA-binding transcriptional regulator [Candidatus Magasanikbacteria bacterium]|nr:YebC/PmpR family DNA-binding transcriptional regulator [Candidatus Magasanikbacteria bacterium]
MSGHSKWANIQSTKVVADKKRAAIFTKYARLVTVAAREGGGGDPAINFKLRMAIDKARSVNMPKDNIERAVARGAGGAGEDHLETALYEALMLNGHCGLLIECLTDNKNRTVGALKTILNKHNITFGSSGSVQWMFDLHGIIRLENATVTDEQELELIDKGVLDFVNENNNMTIHTAPEKFQNVLQRVHEFWFTLSYSELDWVAKNPIAFSNEEQKKINEIVDLLEEEDDVQKIWTNAG